MSSTNDYWKSRLVKWTALDPVDRLSEVLFGLIMVLTFTGTISVSTAGQHEVRELLWAALGCNLSWGIVDAIMNLMDTVIARGHDIQQIKMIRKAKTDKDSRDVIRESISPLIAELMDDDEIDNLGEKMKKLPEPEMKVALTFKDLLIAGKIFLLVFLSTFPVALPFLVFQDVAVAMRVSNGVAVLFLFGAGFFLARYSGLKPLITALAYTALGLFLVTITMVLGG